MVARGELWWIDFGEPIGSAPGYRRPAVIISSDRFNRSRIGTLILAAVTSNLRLADMPGNVALPAAQVGLPKPSVVNVTQLLAVDRQLLDGLIGRVPATQMQAIDEGLRLVLSI